MTRMTHARSCALACAISAALAIGGASAQDAKPAGDTINLDSVVVTGTGTAKSKLKSSVAVTTIGSESLATSSPRSTAEIFRNIPGIRSESSGGEGNANIAVRGLPIGSGGAKFLQLQEDGLPVLEFGDIAFGNADIFLRADNNVERVETIRGGSASTFASNSPGGIINFISKTGDVQGGSVGLTQGVAGWRSTRLDFDYGQPLQNDSQFHVGGFLRDGEGTRSRGYSSERGGQLKANFTKFFEGGYVRVYAKYLNDQAAGYLPSPVAVTGTDGSPHFHAINDFDIRNASLYSPYLERVAAINAKGGERSADLRDGMHPDTFALGWEGQGDLGAWTLTDKFRHADTSARFVSPFPAQVTDASSLAVDVAGAGAFMRWADGPSAGQTYTGDVTRSILFNVNLKNLDNTVHDISLQRDFQSAAGTLNVNTGWYTSRQNIQADWLWSTFAQSLSSRSRLLDIVAADGHTVTQNGLLDYGQGFLGDCCSRQYDTHYLINAPYLSLAWDSGPLNVDGSLRYDMGRARGSYNLATVQPDDVDHDGVLEQPELRVPRFEAATRKPVDYDWHYLSYSFGANYLIDSNLAAFARVSRGARANADRLLFGILRDDGSVSSTQAVNFVRQTEGGLKWRNGGFSAFATAFVARTQEQNYEATSQRFLDRSYKAHGVELEADYHTGGFALNGGLTWTKATIVKDEITPSNEGNVPRRQAKFVWQVTPSYRYGRFEGGLNLVGSTASYTQDSDQLKMPGYTQVNVFVNVHATDRLTISANVNNLFNVFALTEAEEATIPDSGVIRARSLAGRTSSISVRYEF